MKIIYKIVPFWLKLIILLFEIKSVACVFENQPIISVANGNLILAAAESKNITIRVAGDSCFLVNNVNIIDVIRKRFKLPAESSESENSDGDEQQSLPSQVSTLKSDIRRFSGRLRRVESRFRTDFPTRRVRRLLARLRLVAQRVRGIQAKLSENNCASNPCQHDGICYNLYDDFHCECPNGWSGKSCDEDIDECYRLAGTDLGCQNNAACINLPGTYRCSCVNGFTGVHCRERNVDCLKSLTGELCGNGVCVPTSSDPGYTCLCNEGWKSSNVTPACTVDVDECEMARNPCFDTCINLPGTFKCSACPRGYTGNGVTCTDVDECASNNGGCSTLPTVQCINTEGSFYCGNCPPGWVGDGHNCVESDRNSCTNQNFCHPLAKCEFISSTLVCTCPEGMLGNGFGANGCVGGPNFDPCAAGKRCQNGGECIATGRTFFCKCAAGFAGLLCQDKDSCLPNKCRNGGTCHRLPQDRYLCICPRGTSGEFCEVVRNTCGRVIRQETGDLAFPTVGSTYQMNERCAWLIRTHESKILNITFTLFDLENSEECSRDWLQMHDGRSLASRMIGRFCGKALPLGGNIITSHNQIFLWFRSDNATNGGGFRFKWTSANASCGGELLTAEISRHGIIKSPGYPGKSPPNRDCEWRLVAGFSERFILRFFEVIFVTASPNCTKDSLKIYDSGVLTTTLCVSEVPDPMQLSSPFARIAFHTDAYGEDSAFQIHYEVVPGDPHCGGHYTAASGTLTAHMRSYVCVYLIQQPAGTKVHLQFMRFNLIQSNGCVLQKIEIFDGRSDEDPLVGRWCGARTPRTFTSSSNYLFLRHEVFLLGFAHVDEYGYEAKYSRVCGADFNDADGGVFSTPNYPNAYYEHLTCTYNIIGPVNSIAHLNITDYFVSDYERTTEECNDDVDYIEISYKRAGISERHCKDIPMHIVSQTNILRIVFHSTTNPRKARGFQAEYSFETISCGGVLTEPRGSFTKYDVTTADTSISSSYCEWILEAPETQMISLDLLYTRNGPKCLPAESDLIIYMNKTVGGNKLIGSYCGPAERISNIFHTNLMTILLKRISTELIGHLTYGIALNYTFVDSTVACGGNYSFRFGTLRTPDWPNLYPSNVDCTWIIHAPIGHKIELIPTNFSLETTNDENCNDDYLEIRNGMTEQSPLIGRYCGSRIPLRIPSFTNHLYLHFRSDMYVPDIGFSIDWEQTATGCGGLLDSFRGSIHSPNYPEISNGPVQCDWKISVSRGSKIDLRITRITPNDNFCSSDILTLYDGLTPNSKSLPFNCSSAANSNAIVVNSTKNAVFVRYQLENGFEENQKFMLDYETNCRTVIDVMHGVIESPNFPDNYPKDLDCEWDIRGGKFDKITMIFSHLELEFINSSCPYDYIELRDMKDEETLQTLRFCSYQPDVMTTDGNRLLIKFVTDSLDSGSGFRLEFKREGCGGYLTKPFGHFEPPNAPNNVDLNCDWFIETSPGFFITLEITDLNIESDKNDCTANALIVTNDKNGTKPILKECNAKSKAITVSSSANTMYVSFISDSTRSQKYFHATYRSMEGGCGGVYHGLSGEITSPNYPGEYPATSYCNWIISAEKWHSLVLSFEIFDLPNSTNCTEAGLEIYEGMKSDKENKLLFSSCGSMIPPKIYTSSSIVNIYFYSFGNSPVGKGFLMHFNKACFKQITSGSGVIKSNGDEMCNWVIKALEEGAHPSLTFLHVECSCADKMFSRDCPSGVAVYTGSDKSATSLDSGQLKAFVCNNIPNTIFTDEKNIYVLSRNVTFQAEYSFLENACGGRLTSLRGILASPQYPSSYPANVECIWTIEGSRGIYIELNFDTIDIVTSENCNQDYLEVREYSTNGKLLGLFCSNELPAFSLNAFEKFWIKFRSSGNGQVANGFKATWNYVHLNEISGADGVIQSPPIGAILEEDDPFKWRLTVARGHVIYLNFKEFNEGLTLYDGFDEVSLKVDLQPSPWEFTSSTNVILLLSDNQELDRFRIDWKAISKDIIADNRSVSDCYENILLPYDAYVNLSSPGYPFGYAKDLSCKWIVRAADPTQHVVLLLFEVHLEEMDECFSDYVKVSSSRSIDNWHEELKICNSRNMSFEPVAIVHGTPNIKVDFVTDSTVNRTGFSADLITQCGSNLTGSVGTILDHSVMHSRITNHTCIWHIEVRPGKQIEFTFDFPSSSLDESQPETCPNYVVIHDGIDEEAPVLAPGQICSIHQTWDRTLRTTANWATVRYQIKWNPFMEIEPSNLWNLTYREYSSCGGEVRLTQFAHSINITSPRYPNVPHPHTECVWIIIAPPGETIEIQFVERFDMNQQRCNREFVEFLDGSTPLAPSIGRYCVNPGYVRSSGNVMYMRYLTDIPEPRNGFHANISISACGGTFTQSSNVITSVNYPALGGYPSQTTCDYVIKISTFSRIALTLIDVHLPFDANNPNTSDHLIIYLISQSESYRSETELARYYGNTTLTETSKRLDIDSNEALIRFYSHKANSKFRGFKLKYEKNYGMCYKDVSGESGYLSLNYPSQTLAYRLCRWKITVPKGRRVKFEILDAYSDRSFFIDIHNDRDSFSKIARIDLASHNLSQAVLSSDNTMYVRINGGYSTSVKRLRARYSSSEPSDCPNDIVETTSGSISLNSLTVANLGSSFYCKSNFKLNGRETLTFLIRQLTISTNSRSWAAALGVSFRNSDSYDLYGTFQSNTSNVRLVMPAKRGSISFIQNEALKIVNFEGSFRSHSCGGTFRLKQSFAIESTNFTASADYGSLECGWVLNSGSFSENEFDLNANVSLTLPCSQEYIAIYGGATTNSVELGRICRDSLPAFNTTRLTKRYTLIHYHTDKYVRGQSKFRITLEKATSCGGLITVPRYGTKSVIQFDSKAYKNNLECIWELQASTGFYLSLKFIGRFFIESSPNCTKDFLEIIDRKNDESQILRKLCGRESPAEFNTTTNRMLVIFRSDGNITGDGFTLEAGSSCSSTFNVTQDIQTIQYPRRWSSSNPIIHCEYTLQSDSDNLITVRMERGQWGKFDRCRLARFTTFKKNEHGNVVETGEYCRDNVVTELRARKFLKFVYHAIVETGGSDIQFSLESCGGAITQPTNIQHLRSEDDEYATNMRCIWNVTAPQGHAIVVKFKFFAMEKSSQCSYDYLMIYAGTEMSDKNRLVHMCGNLTQNPPTISVDNNRAIIVAISDPFVGAPGFLAAVQFTRNCNERITLTTGNVPVNMSRKLSFGKDEIMICHYKIKAPVGYRVQVEVKKLILNVGNRSCSEEMDECESCNYLEFLGSEQSGHFSLGRTCSKVPATVKITSSFDDFTIVTNAKIPGNYSFEIELKIVKSLCGGRNEDVIMVGKEPFHIDFPSNSDAENYPSNTHCSWRFTSNRVYEIIFNSLALQEISDVTGKCVDYVAVEYGYESNRMKREYSGVFKFHRQKYRNEFCGNASMFSLKVPEDTETVITFHSDEVVESKGFHLIVANKNFCNNTLTETSGVIERSISDQKCVDEVLLPENYTITLYVASVIFGVDNCTINYFKIRDKATNKTLYIRCESAFLTYPIMLSTNQIQVETNQAALNLMYVGTKKPNAAGCGGEIHLFEGQIVNPPYNNDRNESNCRWDIIMPSGSTTWIYFLDFDMGSPANCQLDYLQIWEISANGKEELSRSYCAQDNPQRYVSESNHVAIVAKKSANFDGIGWSIMFKEYYNLESKGIIITN